MAESDPPPTSEPPHDDLIAFLAGRLGISHELTLIALGDWLRDFERTQRPAANASRRGPTR